MFFTKEANGRLRWFAIYSNNYRDDDGKPEIIAARSHRAFTYLVKEKLVPMPELWHWHIPGTRWGLADYVDFVEMERGLFTIATGYVDPGHEKEAEKLSNMDVLVSHGMPKNMLFYDPNDATVVGFHVTKEISVLPRNRAANKHTGFMILQETDTMKKGLRADQREHLKSLAYTDEQLDQINATLQTKDNEASGEGREVKEATDVDGGVIVEQTNPATVQNSADFGALLAAHTKEIAEAVGGVMAPLLERLGVVEARLAEQDVLVKEMTAQQAAQVAQAIEATPVMSVKELFNQAVFGGSAAQIDGRSALAKDTPKEKATTPAPVTGISFIDALMTANRQG